MFLPAIVVLLPIGTLPEEEGAEGRPLMVFSGTAGGIGRCRRLVGGPPDGYNDPRGAVSPPEAPDLTSRGRPAMRPKRIDPGPGRESVWDYPRPPRVEPTARRVRVVFNDQVIADTCRAVRVLETSHPPGIYIPPEDVKSEFLRSSLRSTACEWKGRARYFHVVVGDRQAEDAAWSYPDPAPRFAAIRGFLTFYPGRVDSCFLDEEIVTPQEGNFYGGWITSAVVGPFKGAAGTWGW
jgi:uncharacterized protein (DUF427 family)